MVNSTAVDRSHTRGPAWALVPLLIACALTASLWLRYDHPWAENDTVVLTQAARAVLEEGRIAPSHNAYGQGFAYSALLVTTAEVTGLSVRDVQISLLPWISLGTALIAFTAFRAVIGGARSGAIAASLLLVQPDFLFVTQRGSHEKMTWTLGLALLFTLIASLEGRRLRQITPYVLTFYICGFALLCTNAFFGSSFTTIILLSLLGSITVTRRFFRIQFSRRLLPRLSYIFLVLTALTYVIIFYLYSPAGTNLSNLGRVVDRLAALYLNVDTKVETRVEIATQTGSNAEVSQSRSVSSPYSTVKLGWTNTFTFFLLTLFTWLMLITTFICWLILAVTFVRRGVARSELPLFLVWIFTVAAGVQIAISVGSDFAGVLGSNLQLRLFPVFTLFAIPLVITTVVRYRIPQRSRVLRYAATGLGLLMSLILAAAFPAFTLVMVTGVVIAAVLILSWNRSPWARRLTVTIGAAAFMYFAIAAVLKASNDPLVSNKWTFYSASEAAGVRWANRQLSQQFIWADFDERISAASKLELSDDGGPEAYWARQQSTIVRYLLVSHVIASRSIRIQQPIPNTTGIDRIYDDGDAVIFHRLPLSPYQP